MNQMIGPTKLFNRLSIYGGTKKELLGSLQQFLMGFDSKKGDFLKIFTPNPEQMVLAKENPSFHTILSKADVLLPDGQGLVWAINRNGTHPKVQRIPGREVFHDLLLLAQENEWRVFLLGGKPGSGKLLMRGTNWGYDEGALKIAKETQEEQTRVLEKIKQTHPDLLFVAYGAPWQEKWVIENEPALQKAGVKVAMVVGGAFEYESGKVLQVSSLVESLHLEWLQRLVLEPWRWKRQLKGVRFFFWVLQGKYR